MLNNYVQQNKINKFDNDSDSKTMVIQLEDWKNSTFDKSSVYAKRDFMITY